MTNKELKEWLVQNSSGIYRPAAEAADVIDRLEVRLDGSIKYAIALQQAIECHCDGREIPEHISNLCPHHARKLNGRLTMLPNEKLSHTAPTTT